ncbi:hypothetical protein CEY07_11700 [Bacillus safensis]|nr:DUF3986 family protein [Bacillus safensis]MBR0603399.1 DUF3986 family protein [Bacillus safensis]PCK11754.1 hypothetical protein CEY07_11700 [Bacillus safensis]
MHLHVGYYEQGYDYEGVFFKSLETGRWLLFFDQKSYGLTFSTEYEKRDEVGLILRSTLYYRFKVSRTLNHLSAVFVSLFLFNDKLCVGKIDLVNE